MRGLLAPLDIVPGVSGLTKFSSTVRLASVSENIGKLGLSSGVKGGIQQGATSRISNLVETASKFGSQRLRRAEAAFQNGANIVKNKVIKDTIEAAQVADKVVTGAKNLNPLRIKLVEDTMGNKRLAHDSAVNTHSIENGLRDYVSRIEGVKVGIRGNKDTGGDLRKINIPSIRSGEFNKWFDDLSSEEFNRMWENPELRKRIEDRIRKPGGYHEWHLVARTPKFKKWGISMNDIKEMRTFTKDVKFVNPPGVHGGEGSTVAHNQILRIIDTSEDYETFVKRLNNWAEDRLESGKMGLPIGLRR